MATETREVRDFRTISFYAYGEMIIRQGEQESLTIEADESMLKKVETRVDEGALIIRLNADWLDYMNNILMSGFKGVPFRYELTVHELEELKVFGAASVSIPELSVETFSILLGGAGSIDIQDLKGDRLEVNLRGAGSIKVAGHLMEQSITVSGAGSFSGGKLISETARVSLRGAGSVKVHATDQLDIDLRGLGSVTYYGQPDITKSISGLGDISRAGE